MLASAETVAVVADALRRWNIKTTVVDPVGKVIFESKCIPSQG